jgi:outer membrane protein assembly factor BamB
MSFFMGVIFTAMFRGGATHLGVYDSPPPSLSSVAWRFETGGKIFGSPTVGDGTVYVGSTNGALFAVNAASGALRWKFATKGAIRSTPAVWNGLIFFTSLDGNVYAVDAADGRERWRFVTEGERRFTAPGIHGIRPRTEIMPDPFDVFLSSPAIDDGTLYVGSGDRHVYALDAATGKLRWKFATGNVVHASPAISNGLVYVGSWDRYFYALDAKTGAVRWKFQTGDDRKIYNQVGIAGSAALAGGTVFFGARDSFFYALDAKTGRLRWKHDEHGSWVIGSPAILGSTVYYTTSDEKTFFALNADTGDVKFRVKYGAFAFSSPSIAGNVAYFGSFDGRLYGVDVATGSILDRFSTDASTKSLAAHLAPDGTLDLQSFYTDPTLDGIILGLERIYGLGSLAGSPAIAGGVLYIGSTEGTLYALR